MPKKDFKKSVYAVVGAIPSGQTLTYGKVAVLAGHPGAARAVGTVLSHNYAPEIPCHRVVRADGKLGGYNRGPALKKKLLRVEEAIFDGRDTRC